MIKQIGVVGHPSRYGGADTELHHQILCWLKMGLEVHVVPTGNLAREQTALRLAERGCVLHNPNSWQSLKGMPAISFCNDVYLRSLPEIRRHASHILWVNCMT